MKLLKILKILTGQKSVFPFYHAVSNHAPVHLKHLYKVRNTELFEQDLLFFKKHYNILGTSEISSPATNGFSISFDDGLREFKEVAWPILKKYNIPAILFVNPDFVDNKALFYRYKASILVEQISNSESIDYSRVNNVLMEPIQSTEKLKQRILKIAYKNRLVLDDLAEILNVDFDVYLQKEKPYLSLQELVELQAEGVVIGAHSMDHPLFNELEFNEQIKQIKDSTSWINEHLKPENIYFSFPFTDYGLTTNLFTNMYKQNGFELALSFGTAGIKNERFNKHIQRIPLENNLKSAKSIILGEYLYFLAKAPFFKNRINRKQYNEN